MHRPNMKIVRKRIGYHILAFCLGAMAPLPFITAVDDAPETDARNSQYPDSDQIREWDAGAVRYVESRDVSASNSQDDRLHYLHNV